MKSVLRNVRSSYKELLEVLNIAVSVKAQSEIRARNPVCETILNKCAAIADEWKKGSHHMFEEDSTTLSDYHEVVRYAYRSPCEIFSVDISYCRTTAKASVYKGTFFGSITGGSADPRS